MTALRPELLNGDATVGELAWVWGQTYDAFNQFWRHRLWFVDDRLAGWAWARLPYRVPRGDGTFREAKEANLIWQTHPDRAELLSEMQLHGMQLARASGADRMLVACLSSQAHPAARNMYYGVGFRELSRDIP